MQRLVFTEKANHLYEKNLRPLPTPRHLEMNLRNCCDGTIRGFLSAFLYTTPEKRDLLFAFTDTTCSVRTTEMNRRTYFRKQAIVRQEFIPVDCPECCRKTIIRFLDFLRDCKPDQRELIVHVIKGGTLSNFKRRSRKTAGLWIKEIVGRKPRLGFLQAIILHQDERNMFG